MSFRSGRQLRQPRWLRPLDGFSPAAAPIQQYQNGRRRQDPTLLLDGIWLGALYFRLQIESLFNPLKDKIDAYLYGCY